MGCTEPGFAVGGASPRMDALPGILVIGCDGDLQLLSVRLGARRAASRKHQLRGDDGGLQEFQGGAR